MQSYAVDLTIRLGGGRKFWQLLGTYLCLCVCVYLSVCALLLLFLCTGHAKESHTLMSWDVTPCNLIEVY